MGMLALGRGGIAGSSFGRLLFIPSSKHKSFLLLGTQRSLNKENTLYICKIIKQQPSPWQSSALRLVGVCLGHFISQFENIQIIQGNPGVGKENVVHVFLANPTQTDTNTKSNAPAGHFPGIRELFSHSLVGCSCSK